MEIEAPVFKKELFDKLGKITIEQAESGEGLKIAKRVYGQARCVNDDTTANEAYSYIKMFENNGLLVAERQFNEQYAKTKESAELLLKSLKRLMA